MPRLLVELANEPGRLEQQASQRGEESAVLMAAVAKMSGKTLEELMTEPGGVKQYAHQLVSEPRGYRRFLQALLSGPEADAIRLRYTEKPGTRQVKFECSNAFYKRLMDEKLKRNLTVHSLAMRALERYLGVPESVHRSIEEEAERTKTSVNDRFVEAWQWLRKSGQVFRPQEVALSPETLELRTALEAIQHYLEQMPLEKVRLVREALALDLKYYRSARLKRGQPSTISPVSPENESKEED